MSGKVSWPGASSDRTSRTASWNLPSMDHAARPAFPAASPEPVGPVDPVTPPRPVDGEDNPPITPPPAPTPKPAAPAQPSPLELELQRRVELFGAAIEELSQALDRERQARSAEVVELGLAVAEELAAGAMAVEPSRILSLVEESLDLLAEERDLKVRIHPALIEELDRIGALDDFKENPRIIVRSDSSVGEQGCIVESKAGRVDARIKSRLSKLRYLLSQGEGYEEGES